MNSRRAQRTFDHSCRPYAKKLARSASEGAPENPSLALRASEFAVLCFVKYCFCGHCIPA